MKTLGINDNNDIYIDATGNITVKEDIYALADISKNKVLTNMGELQYNTPEGIPYFNTMFCDHPDVVLFQASIINTLEKTENIKKVSNFDYKQNGDVFSYTVTENTAYGDIKING